MFLQLFYNKFPIKYYTKLEESFSSMDIETQADYITENIQKAQAITIENVTLGDEPIIRAAKEDLQKALENCTGDEESIITTNKLEAMTVEQLTQAVVDFQIASSCRTNDSLSGYSEILETSSDAYRELLTRDGAKEALIEKMKELDIQNNISNEITFDTLKIVIKDEDKFENTFTDEEKELLGIL